MFSNAVLVDGNRRDLDETCLFLTTVISECASNNEEYVTFKFVNFSEPIIKKIELSFKLLHYKTFLCYYMYGDNSEDGMEGENLEKHWFLKRSWTLFNGKALTEEQERKKLN